MPFCPHDHVSLTYIPINLEQLRYTSISKVHNSNFDFRSLTVIIVEQVHKSFKYNKHSNINKILMYMNIAKKQFQRIGF